jgi:GntR family transcriptional regulator
MKTKAPTAPAKLKKLGQTLAHLNRHAPAKSLHALLSAAIVRCISQGDWGQGDRIPTEAELIELSGFSLGTVQRALRSLTEEGVLERKQGSGTFVSKHSSRINDVAHVRFLTQDGQDLLSIYSKVLMRSIAKGTGLWNIHFDDPTVEVMQIDRLLTVNDEFEVFNRFYFDCNRFKKLAATELHELDGANFKTLLEQESAIAWGEVQETLQIVKAPAVVAKAMKLPPRTVVGLLEISRQEKGGAFPIYCQELYIPQAARKMQLLPN